MSKDSHVENNCDENKEKNRTIELIAAFFSFFFLFFLFCGARGVGGGCKPGSA